MLNPIVRGSSESSGAWGSLVALIPTQGDSVRRTVDTGSKMPVRPRIQGQVGLRADSRVRLATYCPRLGYASAIGMHDGSDLKLHLHRCANDPLDVGDARISQRSPSSSRSRFRRTGSRTCRFRCSGSGSSRCCSLALSPSAPRWRGGRRSSVTGRPTFRDKRLPSLSSDSPSSRCCSHADYTPRSEHPPCTSRRIWSGSRKSSDFGIG